MYEYLMIIGKMSGCHQNPDRSFKYKNWQFPVCARCTGLIVGYIIGFFMFLFMELHLSTCLILISIMGIDWIFRSKKPTKYGNIRRCCTGILCGIGYIQLFKIIVVYLSDCFVHLHI